ncbi:amino acid permease [Longirhabdus pacifica]|uniref:amino acid permease n=1 Tax=Longirhabdus pacifica TaxID=2305227 RepID=UPI00100911A6|nr:amino acid permease [Longirhabdus pacifica]
MSNQKGITTFPLTMLALGTIVGGSFFLGTTVAIQAAGPSVLFAFLFGGLLVYFILQSLSEMTTADPSPGSFRTYAQKSFGKGMGFTIGWVYWTGLILAMSSEAFAVSTFLRAYFPNLSPALVGIVIIISVTLINLLGAEKLSKLESGLASFKLLAIVAFIILGILIVVGLISGNASNTNNFFTSGQWLVGGIGGIAGSMLIVMFTYAGFEVIGLAASEAKDPNYTIPRAIRYTLLGLIGLYVLAIGVTLLLTPSAGFVEEESPLVSALNSQGFAWAGSIMNIVMITAILSTMLASTFAQGRMIRSLAAEGHAPSWLKDKRDIPYRGILFSGAGMLSGLVLGLILPASVYLFLISSSGFSLLFTYLVIVASHYMFRKKFGCQNNACRLPFYPYSSWFTMVSIVIILLSMPFIAGQGAGLIAGVTLVAIYVCAYFLQKFLRKNKKVHPTTSSMQGNMRTSRQDQLQMEVSDEWDERTKQKNDN